VFARTIRVEVVSAEGLRPCPLEWLDSFCMRSFTGRSAFDETLPMADGLLQASFQVDLDALRVELEDWLRRKFSAGGLIELALTEVKLP